MQMDKKPDISLYAALLCGEKIIKKKDHRQRNKNYTELVLVNSSV